MRNSLIAANNPLARSQGESLIRPLGVSLAVSGVPFANEGDTVEIVIDAGDLSYRFKAVVEWVREDGDEDYEVGMSFVGLPVRLHYGPAREPAEKNVVDRILVAA